MEAEQLVKLAGARRWSIRVLAVLLGALAVTGIYLFLFYRPMPSHQWPNLDAAARGTTFADVVRTVHRWAALAMIPVSLVAAVIWVTEAGVRWRGPSQRRSGLITGPAVVMVVLVAIVSGFLLAWDQLALWAVTVGSDVEGYRTLLWDDGVRFVLVDGMEVSVAEMRIRVAVHLLLVPVILAFLFGLARRDRPTTDRTFVPGTS